MLLTETRVYDRLSEGLRYHLDNLVPLFETIYRPGSEAYFRTVQEARLLHSKGLLQELCNEDIELLTETEVGTYGLFEGQQVPLDYPFLEEAKYQGTEVSLGKPRRGGPKKFYVYVKNPKTGKIKKVNFGDTTGLKAKINDPKARVAFAKRHNCATKKDKTTPGYWSCRLPRYAKLLGLKSNFTGYW